MDRGRPGYLGWSERDGVCRSGRTRRARGGPGGGAVQPVVRRVDGVHALRRGACGPRGGPDRIRARPSLQISSPIGSYDDEVGLRLKGTTSFRTLDGKAAFKVKFREFVAAERFLNLKTLTLNNMVQDASMIHEVLAYEVFRAAGVPAPRTGYAYVRINDADYGVYLNVETLDDVSLPLWFASTQHLYEGEFNTDVIAADIDRFEADEGDEDDRDRPRCAGRRGRRCGAELLRADGAGRRSAGDGPRVRGREVHRGVGQLHLRRRPTPAQQLLPSQRRRGRLLVDPLGTGPIVHGGNLARRARRRALRGLPG